MKPNKVKIRLVVFVILTIVGLSALLFIDSNWELFYLFLISYPLIVTYRAWYKQRTK